VYKHANTRLTVQSWKSKIADAENPSPAKSQAQPKKPKQAKLRETRSSAEKAWAKLDLNA